MPGPTPEGVYQSLHDSHLVIDTFRCLPLPPTAVSVLVVMVGPFVGYLLAQSECRGVTASKWPAGGPGSYEHSAFDVRGSCRV